MVNRKLFSRRTFVKSGMVAATGLGIIGKVPVYSNDCLFETLGAPGPIPLNDIMVDYQQVTEKLGYGLKKVTICDKESWENKRLNIIRRSRMILGEAPSVKTGVVEPNVLGEIQRDGYKEVKIKFPSGTGDLIHGYLLIPDNTTALSPRPAIIALHSTGKGGTGARQSVGLTPRKDRHYGVELVQRGYVVLAIDVISVGERVYSGYRPYYTDELYKKYPRWSTMGKMIYDHKRGVDYLCSLDIVDVNRLGCIGISLGGYNSFFLHAFDSRIKAAVVACGLSPMGGSNTPYQFARNDWFVHFNPTCRDYIQAGMIPCDMHEIMALCAPRLLFNYSGKKDATYFPPIANPDNDFTPWWQTVYSALNQVSRVYEILGKSDHFVRVEDDGGHDFPADVREDAYRWLDKWL